MCNHVFGPGETVATFAQTRRVTPRRGDRLTERGVYCAGCVRDAWTKEAESLYE